MRSDLFYAIGCVLFVAGAVLRLVGHFALGGPPTSPRRARLKRAADALLLVGLCCGMTGSILGNYLQVSRPVPTFVIILYAVACLLALCSVVFWIAKELSRRAG